MDTNDILKATDSAKRLIQDDNYYKYIFKKTERIVSVVFYILNNVPEDAKSQTHIEDIQHTARNVHDAILQSLESRMFAAEDIVRGVAHALISLESKLTVAQVAGVIAPEVHAVFQNEIDAVLRGMNKYLNDDSAIIAFTKEETRTERPAQRTQPTPAPTSSVPPKSTSPQPDRRARIVTILEAKGEASIKDISAIITDISEKTIQRELNAMIDENIIKRQGERRWSKYSIF